ncbi:MAG: CPBP family intramembrane metalloprotease [Pyrinomonadaceae bacterium]|nr:CPBP family intramembrane metalloprotease [Pyrinomonadaceae bacterium]
MSFAIEHDEDESARREMRQLAFWEIVSLASTALIAVWAVLALATTRWLLIVPVALAFSFIILSHRIRRETARELGWRTDNFWEAMRLLALPMLAAALLMALIGWFMGSLRVAMPEKRTALLWLPFAGMAWGLTQQYVLQAFFNRRAQMVWGKGWISVLVVAFIFALIHLPNWWLALATLAGGIIWAATYQRAPNLLALGLSHGIMTWVLISTVPQSALQSLRVGFKYFG